MKSYTFKVVCGFTGRVYSRHKSEAAARREKSNLIRAIDDPTSPIVWGSLAKWVEVVEDDARFTSLNGSAKWLVPSV